LESFFDIKRREKIVRWIQVAKVGLVLEGGGMRGTYTAGVLEFFMKKELYLPYVIGVSAGACNGSSYISRQIDRNKTVNLEYITKKNSLSFRNIIKKKQLFDMDFIFNDLPNIHVPFDFDTFQRAKEEFVVGTTNVCTGKAEYFTKKDSGIHIANVLRASSSIPFIAPIVEHGGKKLLDGGIADPIPIKKSEADGNKFNIVILTRNKEYQKKEMKWKWLTKKLFHQHPQLVELLTKRHHHYNETLTYIEQQQKNGNAFIIRPSETLKVGSIERKTDKLTELYELGLRDAEAVFEQLQNWLKNKGQGEKRGMNSEQAN
jgi:predicted patatin/cPLA2 family phospholipase